MSAPLWRLDAVGLVRGGAQVLRDLTLEVPRGAAVGLLGPSGAGKTSLLGLLDGSLRPTTGQVWMDGSDRHAAGVDDRALRAAVGFVHQDLALVPNTTVLHNVLVGAVGRLSPLQALRWAVRPPWSEVQRVHAALERVGIGELLYQRIERVSGGERQRVAVARALYQGPRALLADEPVSSLDPVQGSRTLSWLVSLCREEGLTLVTSLHNPVLVSRHLDHAVGLRNGQVVWSGPADTLDDEALARIYGTV